MRRRVVAAIVAPVVVLIGAGGYVAADVYDVAPGWFTLDPVPVPPAPFLEAGAVEPVAGAPLPLNPLLDADAPLPDASAVQALADALNQDPAVSNRIGVSVVDLITGEQLADVASGTPQTPASTTKVLTAIAVVSRLGKDSTLTTEVRYDASRGEIALVAGGDELLGADAGNPDSAVGYAGLGDLADEVAASLLAAGVTSVKLVVDTSAFPAPAFPAEWPEYALSAGYAAPVTGLAINVGKKTDEEYAPRYSDPAAAAADVFAARLGERGVTVTSTGSRAGAQGEVVGSVDSAPLWQVVSYMLAVSDNTVAETLSRLVAIDAGLPGTPANASAQVIAAISELGVDTTGLELYDGAGYSDRNRISPAQFTGAIAAALGQQETEDFLEWLPISAMEGTLDDRFVGGPAAGVVRAKTGSLTGVTSLTGLVITADGRPLLFAVLADGMPQGQDKPRTAVDAFVSALAQCGCSGA